jgi:hypothetical protein
MTYIRTGIDPAHVAELAEEDPLEAMQPLMRKLKGAHVALEGATLRRKTGRRVTAGTAAYLGHRGRTALFRVTYEDGSTAELPFSVLKKRLAELAEAAAVRPERRQVSFASQRLGEPSAFEQMLRCRERWTAGRASFASAAAPP